MITEIGIVAGDIWHDLDAHHQEVRFSQVVADIHRSKELALMSLGWLAREGHVVVREDGGELFVILRR
jgi:hypothetical protein